MSRLGNLGLAARLALSLAATTLIAVGIAALLVNSGLETRFDDYAADRLETAASHSAELAGALYGRDGHWSPATVAELEHAAEVGDFAVELRDTDGRLVFGSARLPGGAPHAAASVTTGGRRVGELRVAPRGALLRPEDRALRHRLDSLHLVAAGLALLLGLVAAAALAVSLTRPLRRLTERARRIRRGELGASHGPSGGGPEIRALSEALDHLADDLRREEQLRRETVADVAHELRTPVGGMLARIEAAQDGVMPDDHENMAAMHSEALRLAHLIEDFERLADAERPGLTLAKEPLELDALVERRALAWRERFDAKGVALAIRLEPAVVVGEAARLEQVIDNLLSNALRYTDAGGTVELAVSERDGEVTIEVTDSGVGIDPADLDHVFTRFWRGERSRSRATGGAGIGLAIARELVRAHDGRIEVESAPGRGSRFRVLLPQAEGAARALAARRLARLSSR